MKVLTLHQPWASFVALGVKRIETRSTSTRVRGRIAIHAGARRPPLMHLPPLSRGRSDTDREHDRRTWLVLDTITDPAYQGPQPQGRRIPKRATTPTLFRPHAGEHCIVNPATGYPETYHLPLGAIVATADLVDVVPTESLYWTSIWPRWGWQGPGGAPLYPPQHIREVEHLHVVAPVAEQPFGDYRSGRWAWLLADVEPLAEPVPFRGGQGWSREWTP